MLFVSFFFFFQAEDGIRDYKVTGVQTCALPITRYLPLLAQNRAAKPLPCPGSAPERKNVGPATRSDRFHPARARILHHSLGVQPCSPESDAFRRSSNHLR